MASPMIDSSAATATAAGGVGSSAAGAGTSALAVVSGFRALRSIFPFGSRGRASSTRSTCGSM